MARTIQLNRVCRTERCGNPATNAWSPFCSRCRNHRLRSGHVEQRSLPPRLFTTYEDAIKLGMRRLTPELQRRLEKRVAVAVALLTEQTAAVLAPDTAKDALTRNTMYQQACAFLHAALTSEHVTPFDLVASTAARFMYRDINPNAYKSDRAFQVLTIQRLGAMAKVNQSALEWNGQRRGYYRRRRRMIPLTAMGFLISLWFSEQMAEVFALVVQVATRHRRMLRNEAEEMAALREDIAALPSRKGGKRYYGPPNGWTPERRAEWSAEMKARWAARKRREGR